MSMKSKLKSFFALDDDEDYVEETYMDDEEYEVPRRVSRSAKQKVVSLQSVQQSTKVMLVEPREYDEVQDIADHLKNHRAVVINLQRVRHEQAMRIVDFLSGTVYAIGGDIQKLGTNTFICTPENVDISGSISEMNDEMETTTNRW